MNTQRASWLMAMTATFVAACESPIEGRGCPCIAGWACEDGVCIPKNNSPDAEEKNAGPCPPSDPFTKVENVHELNSTLSDSVARLTQDELSIYWSYKDAEGFRFIRTAARESSVDLFGASSTLQLRGASSPTIAADGTLYFAADDRTSPQYPDLFVVTPPYEGEAVKPLLPADSAEVEYGPYISLDGAELYFAVRPHEGSELPAQDDLYVVNVEGDQAGSPHSLDSINTSEWSERSPALSRDGLRLYFASNRPGGTGGFDIFMAERGARDAPFAEAVPLADLNTEQDDMPSWISPDECTLYLNSVREGNVGGDDIWRATRR